MPTSYNDFLELLKDAVIYVDSDVLFIDSPQSLWNYFKEFNSQQVSKFYMV